MTWTKQETFSRLEGWECRVGGWLDLQIARVADGTYFLRVGGVHVANDLPDLEAAQALAVDKAREMLLKAADHLADPDDTSPAKVVEPEPEPEEEEAAQRYPGGRRRKPDHLLTRPRVQTKTQAVAEVM